MNRIKLISGELLRHRITTTGGIKTPTTAPIKAVIYKQKRIGIIFSYYCLN